jgi:hypothetical protein
MKTNVFMLTSMIAGGIARSEGKIYALEPKVAAAVFAGHNGREPTAEEIARLGVEKDPEPAPPAAGVSDEMRAALKKKREEKAAAAGETGRRRAARE